MTWPQKKLGPLWFPAEERHFLFMGDKVAGYQRPQRDYAMSLVRDFSLAIDVGAHVGIFSRHFALRFDRVIAFEPIENLRDCLVRNVPPNVEIVGKAVGSYCGRIRMDRRSTTNSGCSFIADAGDYEVEMVTIDSLELPNLGLIKIDVQGFDHIVLHGATETLRRCRPVVLIEEKPIGGPDGPTHHIDATREIMASVGAQPAQLVGADRTYVFP